MAKTLIKKKSIKKKKKSKFTSDAIVNDVLDLFIKRHKQGMKKFKITMEKNNKPVVEWIKDAKEECMDKILYLAKAEKQLRKESKKP